MEKIAPYEICPASTHCPTRVCGGISDFYYMFGEGPRRLSLYYNTEKPPPPPNNSNKIRLIWMGVVVIYFRHF